MKTTILSFLLLTCCTCLMAQEETVILKPGDSLTEFKTRRVYRYPAFVSSRVFYKDGAIIPGKLNYNQLSGKIDLIKANGDTLEFTEDDRIKEAVLDKTSFRYNRGYFEMVKDHPDIKLAKKTSLRLVNQRKIGAMGVASSTMAADTYGTMADGSGLRKLTPNVEYIFSASSVFYFGDANYRFDAASQKRLLKVLPGKKDDITNYLKNNKVNFTRLEDILGLLTYIQKL